MVLESSDDGVLAKILVSTCERQGCDQSFLFYFIKGLWTQNTLCSNIISCYTFNQQHYTIYTHYWSNVLCVFQAQDGSQGVRLGTSIALMVAEGEDWKRVEVPPLDPVRPASPPPTAEVPAPPVASRRPPGASALMPSVSVRSCLMHEKDCVDAVLRTSYCNTNIL